MNALINASYFYHINLMQSITTGRVLAKESKLKFGKGFYDTMNYPT